MKVAFSVGRALFDLPYIEVNYFVVVAVCASWILPNVILDQMLFS
jgi:hypothetical protein